MRRSGPDGRQSGSRAWCRYVGVSGALSSEALDQRKETFSAFFLKNWAHLKSFALRHYGPDTSWQRHDHVRDPNCDTAIESSTQRTSGALWVEPQESTSGASGPSSTMLGWGRRRLDRQSCHPRKRRSSLPSVSTRCCHCTTASMPCRRLFRSLGARPSIDVLNPSQKLPLS
jgi:hypothetical protein